MLVMGGRWTADVYRACHDNSRTPETPRTHVGKTKTSRIQQDRVTPLSRDKFGTSVDAEMCCDKNLKGINNNNNIEIFVSLRVVTATHQTIDFNSAWMALMRTLLILCVWSYSMVRCSLVFLRKQCSVPVLGGHYWIFRYMWPF